MTAATTYRSSHDRLLAMIPALAVAALDAAVHEKVTGGAWSAEPGWRARQLRPALQLRDLRRAATWLEDCNAGLASAELTYDEHPLSGAARHRVMVAEERREQAAAFYQAVSRAWYGNVQGGWHGTD